MWKAVIGNLCLKTETTAKNLCFSLGKTGFKSLVKTKYIKERAHITLLQGRGRNYFTGFSTQQFLSTPKAS